MFDKKSYKTSFFKKIFFSIITFALFFLMLEYIVRTVIPSFNYNAIFYEKNNNHKVFKGENTFLFENKISNKFLTRVKNKNDDFVFKKNKKKIIFIGDSVTLGYGVKFNDNYVELFKSKLNDQNYQVIGYSNIGINFIDVFDEISKGFIKNLNKGDTIIYQFNYNDITPLDDSKKTKSDNTLYENLLKKIFSNFQKIKFKYLNYSSLIKFANYHFSLLPKKIKGNCHERKLDALGQYTFAYSAKGYEEQSKKIWLIFEKKINEIKTLLEKKNIKFYILISPISLQLKKHEIVNKLKLDINCGLKDGHQQVIEVISKNKILNIDPLEAFKQSQYYSPKILFHEFDTNHPNKYGHEILANEVINKLSK